MSEKIIPDALLEYGDASFLQIHYVQEVNEHGGIKPAARALGLHHSSIQEQIKKLKAKASIRGYSPEHDMVHAVPETHIAKGVSTYYDAEGKPRGQWVKSSLKQEAYNEMVRAAIGEYISSVPQLPLPAGPKDYSTDVIPFVNLGDAHIGMLAHAAEVGESFDLKIAEREVLGAISLLIDEMPSCERVVLNDLGDGTHYENMSATTEASGNVLDFDSRFPKMIKVYVRVLRFIIEKLSTKARFIDVIINQGNHSRTNDFWAAELVRAVYEGNERIHVLNNESVFIPYRMGNTFVMVHHSDKCKPARLAQVMATDFAKDWGETEHRYIDIGHVHSHMVSKEHPGVFIESFNNLAPNDRWAHDAGYRSRKSITVVLRSRTYGEIGRRVLCVQEVRDRMLAGQPKPAAKKAYTV
jgi:hypothetical protein